MGSGLKGLPQYIEECNSYTKRGCRLRNVSKLKNIFKGEGQDEEKELKSNMKRFRRKK